jgi:Ras-related protein Rab-28
MRTVRKEKHTKYAQQHQMSSHFVSAKTNDLINACFLKVAAEVMKVKLTPADIQRVTTVVKAELTVAKGSSPDSQEPDKKNKNLVKTSSSVCSVQ